MPQAAEPETFQIAEILEEHRTAGRAKMWYLVRWEGYRQEWEAWRIRGDVGSPLETWEPLSHVRGTEAFQRWQAAQEEGSSSRRNHEVGQGNRQASCLSVFRRIGLVRRSGVCTLGKSAADS